MAVSHLTTGVPGSGKTAHAMVNMLQAVKDGRPIFVHGIPNLKINHTLVICTSDICTVCPDKPVEPIEPLLPEIPIKCQIEKSINRNIKKNYLSLLKKHNIELEKYNKILKADEWHLWAPDGAFIFYDEVHFIYPTLSSSAKQPDSVIRYTTHRHKGIDFFLLTQSPLLLEKKVRLLCGKHIHLRPTWLGRYQYEYPECNDNVKSTGGAVKSKYKLNKKVFDLYKSSSLHTENSRKIPFAVYILMLMIFLFTAVGYMLNSRFNDLQQSDPLDSLSKTEVYNGNSIHSENDNLPFQLKKLPLSELVNYAHVSFPSNLISTLPTACFLESEKIAKCTVPRVMAKLFNFSFCLKNKCYVKIKIASPEPIPVYQGKNTETF